MSASPTLSAGSWIAPAGTASVTVTTGCLCCSTMMRSIPLASRAVTNGGKRTGRSGVGAGACVGYCAWAVVGSVSSAAAATAASATTRTAPLTLSTSWRLGVCPLSLASGRLGVCVLCHLSFLLVRPAGSR